jgi:arylsulfatase A-like enzyme
MLMVAACSAAGCSDAPRQVEFVDLVADQSFEVDGDRLKVRESFAADETWTAAVVDPGSRATAAARLHEEPILDLGGALKCQAPGDSEERGTVFFEVWRDGGARITSTVELSTESGWWHRTVDLNSLAGETVNIGLETDFGRNCTLLLREATIRQKIRRSKPVREAPTQIVLISVDTLRVDAVDVFGGETSTPAVRRFASEAERFTRHYAAANWTKPSHASMLTGYHPQTHRAQLRSQAMDPEIPTLAGRFRAAGFATGGLVFDCTWLSPRWGFNKGFDNYRVTRWRAARQARAASRWIAAHREEPFFFFLHTFEPHSDFKVLPYEAPGLTRRTIAENFGVHGFGCRGGFCSSKFLNALTSGKIAGEPEDTRILRATYDAGVEYVDRSLGEFFDSLRSAGLWENLMVIVTADHGEEFGEHGGFSHDSLYDEVLRVPLLVKWPGGDRGGSVNEVLTSSVDLAPTLLSDAGLSVDGLPGTHLHRRRGDEPVYSGTLSRVVVDGRFKGIFGDEFDLRELYDLAADPEETVNLVELDPDRDLRLERLLRDQKRQALALYRLIGSKEMTGEVELSRRERERLRAFGYLE